MKSNQISTPAASTAQALQNALGMLRQTNDAPKWSMGGIGGVTPDGDAAGAYGVYRRGLTDGELDPPPAPCQTDLPQDERISEDLQLNHRIHRIK